MKKKSKCTFFCFLCIQAAEDINICIIFELSKWISVLHKIQFILKSRKMLTLCQWKNNSYLFAVGSLIVYCPNQIHIYIETFTHFTCNECCLPKHAISPMSSFEISTWRFFSSFFIFFQTNDLLNLLNIKKKPYVFSDNDDDNNIYKDFRRPLNKLRLYRFTGWASSSVQWESERIQ